jgi:hypothetical protein
MEGARMPRQSAFRSEVVSAPARAAVYASAKNYSLGRSERKNAVRPQQGNARVWQEAIWDFYDIVPEYRFAVSWVGNLLSRATLLVHKDGVPTQETAAVEAMAGLFGGPEGQAEMLRLLGVHFTAVGEAFIVGIPEGGDHGDDWMIAAASEVTRSAGDNGVWKVGSDELPEDALVIRLWKPHPRKPKESDCPSRAVIPILSELNGLTQHVAAQIDSRLSGAGVLLLPSEMDLPARMQTRGSTVDGEEVAETSVQLSGPEAFAQVLSDTMGTSIGDRKSASRLVPVILQGPGEYLDRVRLVQFWSGLDEAARTLREEAIRRLSLGMDMPPEVLTGTADVNHWGAWQIEEAAIKAHTEPLLDVICGAITEGYLRPYLEAENVPDAASYDIVPDTAQLRMRPNRSKEAIELYDRAELKGEVMLRENGFDPVTDQMTPDERVQWFVQKVASGQTTPDIVAEALRALGVQIAAPADSSTPPAQERPVRSLDDHPRREPPDTQNQAAAASLDPLVSAAEVMVFRALERAGNRLKARFGTPIDIPAFKLYLSVPTLSRHECEELLTDAWSCVGQLGYGAPLEKALQEYTIGLLRLSKVHEREALGRHLALSFTAVTAA